MRGPRIAREWATLVSPLVFTTAVLFAGPELVTGDTWYCIQAGEDLLQNGLPYADRTTLLGAGRPWIDQQWLSHVVMALVFRATGLTGLAFVAVLFVAGTLYFAAQWQLRERTPPGVVAVGSLIAAALLVVACAARAQTLCAPLMLALLLLAQSMLHGRTGRFRWALVLVAVWGNVHGSALLGALLLSGVSVWCAIRRRDAAPRWFLNAFVRGSLPWLMLAAGPYGFGAVQHYHAVLMNPALGEFITEWWPLMETPYASVAAPVSLVAGVLALLSLVRRPNLTALLIAASAIASFVAARYVFLTGIAVAFGLAPTIRHVTTATVFEDERFWRKLGLVSVAGALFASAIHFYGFDARYAQRKPAEALDFAAAELGPIGSIYTTASASHRLLLKYPQTRGRISHDCRVEHLAYEDVRFIARAESGAFDALDRLARDFAVVVLESPRAPAVNALLRDSRFILRYRDQAFAVFVRNAPVHRVSGSVPTHASECAATTSSPY